jgi:Ca-activated chloride channel family protein
MYEGETENYFLLLMQPPKRVPPKEIPPREYVFILDVSGSMRGFPLDTAKKLMKNLIGRLRPRDRFNVMFFSGGSALLWETSLPATGDNLRHALRFIDARRGGGGTRILPALQRALSLPETGGFSRTFIVVTDGYVRVEREVFQMIGQSLGEANIFPFGIGSSVNRFLIEGMARAGMGEPFVVLATGDVSAAADSFRKYVQTPVLTRGEIEFEGFPAYDVEPPGIPDLFASRPVTVFGKWPKDQKPRGTIHLTGITGGDPYSAKLQVEDFSPSEKNAALKYLWARRRIATLTDEYGVSRDDRLKAEITRLGLAYHLLTSFTSFVAVDTRVRRTDEGLETVEQPLPLPQGVTDAAVGANAKARMASPAQPMMSVRAVPKKVLKENRSLESADGKAQDEESTASAEKEKAPVTITLNASKTAVSGGLTKKAVNEFAGDRLSELSGCFPAPPAEKKALTGGVPLTIVVEKSGRVRAVSIEAKWLSGTDAAECLVKKIINWRFPEAEEKTTIRLLFILVF